MIRVNSIRGSRLGHGADFFRARFLLLVATLGLIPTATAQVPTNGLIAYYPFDGDTKDKSGAANDGIGTSVTPTTDRYGVANAAYLFNGVNSVITIPHAAAQNAMPFTVACWFKIAGSWSGEGALVGKYSAGSWNGWQLGINPSTHLVPWYVVNQSNTVIGDYGNPPFLGGGNLDNAWHHVVFTVDAATGGKLYLDGALVSQRAWVGPPGPATTASVLRIGQYNGSFNGAIDEVRIYNRALSSTEVSQFYLAQSLVAPVITAQPQTVWINSGDPAKFSITGNGATSYQWYRYLDGIGQTAIAGATAAELTLPTATFNATSYGYYVALAQNSAGLTWSDYAYTLFITRQPANATVAVGGTNRFSFDVTEPQHAPGQAFQWRRNGVAVTGATGTSYTPPAAVLADNGAVFDVQFSRVQAGVLSTGLSAKAVLTVTPPVVPTLPVIVTQPQSVTLTAGERVIFSVTASGATNYQWSRNGTGIGGATTTTLVIASATVADAGSYTVAVTNAVGTMGSSTALLTVNAPPSVATASATHSSPGFVPGGTATITVTITYAGALTALGYRAVIPTGWSYAGGSGEPGVKPASGNTGALDWAWPSVGASPLTFAFTLNVPSGTSGTQLIAGAANVRSAGGSGATEVGATPSPLSLVALASNPFHSADTDRDRAISLTELTRVIELFNYRAGTVRTGQYREQGGTEDGYAAGPGTLAAYHAADTNRDGAISLTELTRVIELFNFRTGTVRTGQYRAQAGTEDGFAPGP